MRTRATRNTLVFYFGLIIKYIVSILNLATYLTYLIKGPVTRVPHGQRMRNEWRLTIKKRMMLTKEKNNTHKLRILPNDERPFKGSSGHETDINGCQKKAFVPHT